MKCYSIPVYIKESKTLESYIEILKKKYPKYIKMFIMTDGFIRVFYDDTKIISRLMFKNIYEYKFSHSYIPCCTFTYIDKIQKKLDDNNIYYVIVDMEKGNILVYDESRTNNYDHFLNNVYKNNNSNKRENFVKVGDAVVLYNLKNKNKEKIVIVPTYYEYKPIGNSKYSYQKMQYKENIIKDSCVEKGEIHSNAPLAQKLLNSRYGDIITWIDDDGNDCKYKITKIDDNNL